VTGGEDSGGICGYLNGSTANSYWLEGKAGQGVGNGTDNTIKFGLDTPTTGWPDDDESKAWGFTDNLDVGKDPGDGRFWKDLGGWNNGSPVFPKLYWE
jgi:hypothetical protein